MAKIVKDLAKLEDGFDPINWVSDHNNIALQSNEDVVLFEYEKPGVVTGHYYFKSRGRKAIEAGKAFLAEVFNPDYKVQVVRGLTPITNLGARWMSRRLGFTSHGVVNTTTGPHEIFIMHRKEFVI